MTLSENMRAWLRPLPPTEDWSTAHSPASHASGESENINPDLHSAPKKRARVSSVVDVDDMVSSGFMCCNRMRCVESFVLGKGDVKTLRAEQAVMCGLTGKGRSSFVHTMIPLVDPGRNKGALYAGRQLVCSSFFRKAFNVSNNLIQARKGNPGSPALKG